MTSIFNMRCPECGESAQLPATAIGDRSRCTRCGTTFVAHDGSSEDQECSGEIELVSRHNELGVAESGQEHAGDARGIRKHGALKSILAVVIGMAGGFTIRVAIALPLALFFSGQELPQDLILILDLISAFIAGSLVGSLLPRFGWLFGTMTQIVRIVAVLIVFGIWGYAGAEQGTEISLSELLRAPFFRSMVLSVACAGIGGAVAGRHREAILSFLRSVFGIIAGGGFCAFGFVGLFVEFYFLYLGGKAIFEDSRVVKGLAIGLIVGPVVSGLTTYITIGLVTCFMWLSGKIYNWYAEDLEPVESRTSLL